MDDLDRGAIHLTISSELGMRPLAERVTERQEWVQTLPETTPTYPSGLTE